MTRLSFKIVAMLVLLAFLPSLSIRAQEVAEISTPETISTQIIKPADAAVPYAVTGEGLVNLITHMVDFNVTGSSIIFNRSSGQLIVKNTPGNLSLIENILYQLRKASFKQVEIEARIITVTADDVNSLGLQASDLDLTAFLTKENKELLTTNFSGNNIAFPDVTERVDATTILGQEYSLAVMNKRFNFETIIDALKSRAEVNTLAAPRITVFNNQRAHIKIADYTSFVSEVDGSIETQGDILFFTIDTTVRRAPSGTLLDVTPTVNQDGTITLTLHPMFVRADMSSLASLSTITQSIGGTGATLAANDVVLPEFTTQSIDTTVVIPDGGIAVLGGLIDETETKTLNKIPFLSAIPLLGRYFKNDQKRNQMSHLIMFIKATSQTASEDGRIQR